MNLKVNGIPHENLEKEIDAKNSPMILMGEISRIMGERIRNSAVNYPVAQKTSKLILFELSRKDGRTQLELANLIHMKAPTISVALQKLEKDGYVRRCQDEYDLRSVRVYLTEKGKECDEQIKKRFREEEALITGNLTKHETETLIKILKQN